MEPKRLRVVLFMGMVITLVLMICCTAVPKWASASLLFKYPTSRVHFGLWKEVSSGGDAPDQNYEFLTTATSQRLNGARAFSILSIVTVVAAMLLTVCYDAIPSTPIPQFLPSWTMVAAGVEMIICTSLAADACRVGGCKRLPDFAYGPMFVFAWITAILTLTVAAMSFTYQRWSGMQKYDNMPDRVLVFESTQVLS